MQTTVTEPYSWLTYMICVLFHSPIVQVSGLMFLGYNVL